MGNHTAMLVVVDGRVLMVQQRYRDSTTWMLPGGSPRLGESPQQTAVREVTEQTGYDTVASRVVIDAPHASGSGRYQLVHGQIVGGRARLGTGLDAVGGVGLSGLGWHRCDVLTETPEHALIAELLPDPPVDVGRLDHGYRNDTRVLPGQVVEKRYRLGHETQHLATETRMLTRAGAAGLAVPEVLGMDAPHAVVWMRQLSGVNGQALLEHDPDLVLGACGKLARRLNQVLPGWCHGDFGPHNLLLDPTTGQVVGLVDWENAHHGPADADVAWAELVVRLHHPDLASRLNALYGGYGATPAWTTRHEHKLAAVRARVAEAATGKHDAAVRSWTNKLQAVAGWAE